MGKRKLKVVLDTNVLVSVLLFGGKLEEIYKAWKSGKLTLLFTVVLLEIREGAKRKRIRNRSKRSEETLEEFVKVLHYPKFGLSEEEIDYLLYVEVLPYSEIVEKVYTLPEDTCKDKYDVKFLECALSEKANLIVSGDKDLPALKEFKGIKILNPLEFKKILKGNA